MVEIPTVYFNKNRAERTRDFLNKQHGEKRYSIVKTKKKNPLFEKGKQLRTAYKVKIISVRSSKRAVAHTRMPPTRFRR